MYEDDDLNDLDVADWWLIGAVAVCITILAVAVF
jgi:hypothetical protein